MLPACALPEINMVRVRPRIFCGAHRRVTQGVRAGTYCALGIYTTHCRSLRAEAQKQGSKNIYYGSTTVNILLVDSLAATLARRRYPRTTNRGLDDTPLQSA